MAEPTEPIRKLILAAVIERLRRITRVNGFATDAGQNLVVGAIGLGPSDPDVGLSLVPEETARAAQVRAKSSVEMPLQISALAKVSSWEASELAWLKAEDIIGDIHQAMETEEFEIAGFTVDIGAPTEVPLDRPEGGETVGAAVNYPVVYARGWGVR